MCGNRLTGPHGANLFCGVVANREHEIHLWRARDGEFIPTFASQTGGGQSGGLELPKGKGIHVACRMTSGAKRMESRLSAVI
jgi:hypothetical protein